MMEKRQAGPVGPARQARTERYEQLPVQAPPPPASSSWGSQGRLGLARTCPSSSCWSLKQPGRGAGALTASAKAQAAAETTQNQEKSLTSRKSEKQSFIVSLK